MTEYSDEVLVGGEITLRSSDGLQKAGYTFLGWTIGKEEQSITVADDTGQIALPSRVYQAGESITLSESMDLSPLWIDSELRKNRYLVLYRSNGGEDTDIEHTAYLVEKNQKHDITEGEPTRRGYTFAGWKTDASGTIYGHGDERVESYTVSSDVTFTAQWELKTDYKKVTYNANDATSGNVPVDNNAYDTGENVIVLNNVGGLTRTGYVFAGWSTDKDAASADYQPGSTFEINDDITLYAVWKAQTYTVTTSAGAGGSITEGSTVNAGGSFTFKVTVNSGYKLDAVTVNGEKVALNSENSYTITNINKDQIVIVNFTSTSGGSGGGSGGGDTPTPTPTPDPDRSRLLRMTRAFPTS